MPEPERLICTVAGAGQHETEVRRSRFLCTLARVADETEAQAFVREVRKRYWDATHNCSAYVVGPAGEVQRSSDDGEPGGTAGVPMLQVLLRRGLTDTAAVVTRYFGGTKLGAGGLVRAYGGAVSAALDAVGVLRRRPHRLVTVGADYLLAGRLENELRAQGRLVREVRYGEAVEIEVAVAESEVEEYLAWVSRESAGAAAVTVGARLMVDVAPG